MPEKEMPNLPIEEGPPHQHPAQGIVQVGLVLEGLHQLEQVLAQLLVTQGPVQLLHSPGATVKSAYLQSKNSTEVWVDTAFQSVRRS